MSKNHNPYLRLFTRDIEGSPKVNSLSMEASGLYFRLLNRLTEPPVPGSIALHEWEPHNTWQRSLTQQCLATPDKQERLQYFAKLLTRYFQWRTNDILKALRELYFYGIIVIEDDRLIQPRMYRDNGYKLADDPIDAEHIDRATGAYINDDNDSAEDYKSHLKNEKKKNTDFSHARVHARHALSNENENNNIDNDNNIIDNEEKINKKKTGENEPVNINEGKKSVSDSETGAEAGSNSTEGVKRSQKPRKEEIRISFDEFWDAYDKKIDRSTCEPLWAHLKPKEQEAVIAYIPLYKDAQPNKRYRKHPATFLRHRGWEDELIRDNDVVVKSDAQPKEGDPVKATAPKKYKKW